MYVTFDSASDAKERAGLRRAEGGGAACSSGGSSSAVMNDPHGDGSARGLREQARGHAIRFVPGLAAPHA